jgi:hypothetical protein
MQKVEITSTNKDEAVPVEHSQEAYRTEKIKSQVLAKIGRPPRLHRVEITQHHGGKYRVNIWQQPEPDKDIAVTIAPRIGHSYYLTVSDTGEIIASNPPLNKLCSSA